MAKLARFQRFLTDDAGNVRPNEPARIRSEATGIVATIYSDRAGTIGIVNPTASDAAGLLAFHVAGGAYRIESPTNAFEPFRYVAIGTAAEYDINQVSRYDFIFSSTGLLGDGEALPHIPAPVAVTLLEDLPGSFARSTSAPSGEVIIQFQKSSDQLNWTNVFTATFAIGATVGTFTLAADASLAAGDLLRPVGPLTHDPTFEGFSATIATLIE